MNPDKIAKLKILARWGLILAIPFALFATGNRFAKKQILDLRAIPPQEDLYFDIARDHASLRLSWPPDFPDSPTLPCLPGDSANVFVKISNRSELKINSSTLPLQSTKPVNLGTFIIDKEGHRTEQKQPHFSFSPGFNFNHNSKTLNDSRLVNIELRCPQKPGRYKIEIEYVQEGVGWLHDFASADSWLNLELHSIDLENESTFISSPFYESHKKTRFDFGNMGRAEIQELLEVYRMAYNTLVGTTHVELYNNRPYLAHYAGSIYPMIWIRDMTSIQKAFKYLRPRHQFKQSNFVDLFLKTAYWTEPVYDWIATQKTIGSRSYDKNDVQVDQEFWLAEAALDAVDFDLVPRGWIEASNNPLKTPRINIIMGAVRWVFKERWNDELGCVYSGHTADWGDVGLLGQDELTSTKLDHGKPYVCGLFPNILALQVLSRLNKSHSHVMKNFHEINLLGGGEMLIEKLSRFINERLWQEDRGFFKIHLHLDKTSHDFFDENNMFALGGHTLALASPYIASERKDRILDIILKRQEQYHISSISGVLLPPYPRNTYANPIMSKPFEYQNGGQWDWFGLRVIKHLYQRNHELGGIKLLEIARRVKKSKGFYEWYTPKGEPRGSRDLRAAAAMYIKAMHEIFSKGPR